MVTAHRYVEPKPLPAKPAWLKVFRPLAGAILGFTSFLVLASPYLLQEWFPNSHVLVALSLFDTVLLAPGLLASFVLGRLIATLLSPGHNSQTIFMIIVFGVSSVPLTVIGFLLGLYKKFWRISGVVALVLYILLMLIASPFWLSLWSA